MRKFFGFLLLVITIGLIYVLDHPLGALPAIGRLIDPVNGCWANAEPVKEDFTADLSLPVQADAKVWLDDRLITHVHAGNDHDLYFLQGYIHASFRLWQMDMESRAAAGRVSEVIGAKTFNYDRKQRRKGMVYAAENSLRAMESDPRTHVMMDAYTQGINHYIGSLSYKRYPLEYKLMGFRPEPWTNLKTALMLKYMADDLTGYTEDIPLTFLKDLLSPAQLDLLYPESIPGSSPVIPAGTVHEARSLPVPPVPADSLFPHITRSFFDEKSVEGKGSNNWVMSGARTQSGAPILCNDPHLSLILPSLWYEMQLQAPGLNVYGASLPGAPGVIIGFNDSLTWGFTNNYRDVKDFYMIKPVENDGSKYWFSGNQLTYKSRVERISVKGQPDFVDTVLYTIHGPVMYDARFPAPGGFKQPLAMCWMAHRATNELLAVYLMNKAQNYQQFVSGIFHFECPAQNMAYADRAGNIALWGQGQFVNKWKGQGKFIMNGWDSATLWKELIPMTENPHVLNPAQGYVTSANQSVTDSTYPYWYNGHFAELRSWRINQVLGSLQKATVQDMFGLQNDVYSVLASKSLPVLLRYVQQDNGVATKYKKYIDLLSNWDDKLGAESVAATLYQRWWTIFQRDIWSSLKGIPEDLKPLNERTMQLIEMDSLVDYTIDGKPFRDAVKETAVRSFTAMAEAYDKDANGKDILWYMDKNTTVAHLTKLPAFSYDHLKIGGWGNTVNATRGDHGPSWRMVVQMGREIEAYATYPGGQSGNPGSQYYNGFLDHWVEGQYYRLQFLPNAPQQDNKNIRYTWNVSVKK